MLMPFTIIQFTSRYETVPIGNHDNSNFLFGSDSVGIDTTVALFHTVL